MKNTIKLLLLVLFIGCSNSVTEEIDNLCNCYVETVTTKVVNNGGVFTIQISKTQDEVNVSCEQDGTVVSGNNKLEVKTIKCKTIN